MIHGQVPRAVSGLPPLRRLEATNVLQLAIGLPLRNQAELTNLLQEIYDPASPNYRHFLTPEDYAGRFGPTEQDYQALTDFARTNGLRVTGTHPNRMLLDVAGPVPAIEKAFRVNLQVYRHPTEQREFYAPDTEPQLELAVPVLHISGLDNFVVPRPLCHPMSATVRPSGAAPASGSGASGNYAGKDFRAAYAPGVTNTGAGQAVGLLEFQGYYASDIATYETNYSLPAVPLNNVLLGGVASITTDAGDAECPLDIEMAISMAPGLSQVIVYCTTRSGNTDDILNRMATDNLAKQLSASWIVGADATALQIYQQFAVQGQSYFNASGDSDAGTPSAPVGEDAPYITVVGGTTLSTSGAGGSWTSETTWNNGGGTGSTGGISPTYGMPVWQQGISMDTNQGSAFMRNVPDVALTANNIWVLYNNGGSGAFGGTSCATPLWAGFLALVNQQAAANGLPYVGFLNPTLYALGKGTNYTATFHDIITGNNAWSESPNQYYAVPGYDLCTGWGTPTGSNLINALVFNRFDPLVITPTNGFTAAGPVGGPFTPATYVYSPANNGSVTTNWSLINTSAWCSVSPASGTLSPGGSANVTVTVGAAANSLPAGYYPATLLFSNASTHVVQSRPLELVVGSGVTWDSIGGGGAPQDGSGIWADPGSGSGTTNWWNGADDVFWANASPEVATFGANSGAAGTVTLGGPVTAAGINFGMPGGGNYTIASGGYTLTLDGAISVSNSATIGAPVNLGSPGTFTVAGGQTLAVSGLLSGAAGNALAINGSGTVNLSGTSTSASAGMAGAVTVNFGTLVLSSFSSTYGTLGNVAGITVGAGAVLSLQGNNEISGSSGTARTVTVNNGMVTNSGGTRALGRLTLNDATLAGPGTYTLKGDVFGSNAVISAQTVATVAGMSFNAGSGNTLAFSGTLTGSGGLTFAGPGTMIFSGTNSSSAGTTIRPGTLQVGTGGAGSSLGTGAVTNSGLLEFNRSDSFTWGVPVADPNYLGSFIKLNTNTISLTATNNFLATSSGAIQVNGGTLQINPAGLLVSGAEFWVAENAATGACLLNGGTLVVSNWLAVGRNNSSALGTLTVNSGVIQEIGNGGNLIMGSLGGNGTLTVNGGAVSNNAGIWLGEGSTGKGTLNLNGGLAQATQITRSTSPGLSAIVNFNGGTLEAATNQSPFMAVDAANVLAGNAIIDDGGYAIAISQGLLNGGGGGGLIKNGSGTLTLTATNNTYTGPTTVNAGTLKVSPDPVLHLSFDNVSGTNIINDGTGGSAMNGVLTGTATLSTNGGRFGNALSIPSGAATAAYVFINNPVVAMTGTGSWTLAMWIKTSTAGGVYAYQGSGSWASGNMVFYLNEGSDGGYGTNAGGVSYAQGWETGTTAINNGAWHFVVMTCNGSTKAMYVDGNVDTITHNWAASTGVGSQLWIGGAADTGDEDLGLGGLIDEVYVFNRALSQTEVKSLMTYNSLGGRQVLPPATALTLAAGTTFDMSRLSQSIGSLTGASGSSVLLGAGTNASNLTISNTASTTFAGTISGNGSVTKNGPGSITLSGINTYAGSTTINTGTVALGQSNNSNLVATLQPLLWFTFSQVGGGVVTNLGTGGSAMNGKLTGTASISASGRYGSCLSIPPGAASASYVLVNNPVVAMTGANAWTIGMWVKTSTAGGVYAYQGSGGWASGNMMFYLNEGSDSGYGTKAGGVSYAQGWEEGATAINNNTWHFVVMTCNGSTKAMYLDGNVDAITSSWAANTGVGTQLWIGGSPDTTDEDVALNGLIDEVYVFNRALSQTEIRNLMGNASVDPITTIAGLLPATTPVSVAPAATLDLAGISQTVASLSNLGGGGLVTNSASTPVVLVLSNATATTATFSGEINDNAVTNSISVSLTGNGTQVLAGASGYSGTTSVSGGSLLVNGSLGTGAVTVTAGTLGGVGVINGPAILSGGTLAPGPSAIGTFTFNAGLTLSSGGTTLMKINTALPANDQLAVTGTLNYGGTLALTNLGGTLVAGNSFKLFNAVSYTGAFASLAPASPGSGLAWNTNTLTTDGMLRVVAAAAPGIGVLTTSGTGFSLGITGGPPSSPWRVLTSGDLTVPLADWTPVWTNVFDLNGDGQFTNPVDPTEPQQFFEIVVP